MTNIPIIKQFSGLYTEADPARSQYNAEAGGLTTLAACMNVDISDQFRISRRRGITRKITSAAHSLYPIEKRYCLFVSGSNLNLLLPNMTEYLIVATVTEGLRVSCFVLDGIAYWSNGAQRGKIVNGENVPWVMGTVASTNVTRTFYDPPEGKFLGYYNGRVYIVDSQDNRIVWYSEPYAPDVFSLADSFISFESNVTMLRPVSGGIYIGESEDESGRTWFLSGDNPQSFKWIIVDSNAALPYSDKTVIGAMNGKEWISGGKTEVAFWLTNNGIMFGDSIGQVQNITEEKIDLISVSSTGAVLVDGSTLIAKFI